MSDAPSRPGAADRIAPPAATAPVRRGPPRRSRTLARTALGIAVAAMGMVNILSALLSHSPSRLQALRRLVPTDVLDTSRTFTLLAGALLLVTAWGLRRGKRRAFVVALLLCAVSVPVNLLKAFDFEEATMASVLMFALGVSADAFRVRSREPSWGPVARGVLWGFVFIALYVVAGTWLLELQLGHRMRIGDLLADAAWRAFGIGAPVALVPASLPHAAHRIADWYARSLPVLGFTLAVGAAVASLRPARHRRRHQQERERVLALLEQHGDSTVAAFALDDEVDYFFSDNSRAVIAYRYESDTLLAIGDPIGPREEWPALLIDFERYCEAGDWEFAFFQARDAHLDAYRERGWHALHIGEDPVIDVADFTLEGPAVGDVRRAVHRAGRAGLEVRQFGAGGAVLDPDHGDRALVEELRAISDGWLAAHAGGEKGFCMGRFDAARLGHAWLAVAWNGRAQRVEGFVTWEPIWARKGWALDLMRRRQDSAPGTMELLIARSAEAARARGDGLLSLSLSALARVGEAQAGDPGAGERTRVLLRRHLARFYDFEGLFRWKRKFAPRFEDRYLVYPGPFALPRVALALVRAQSPSGLRSYLNALLPARRAPAARPGPDAAGTATSAAAPGTAADAAKEGRP